MHDPMTVAFELKYPWYRKTTFGKFHDSFITIWHVDPETNGSDDSCDWFGSRRKLNPREKELLSAIYDMEPILCNRPIYPDHPAYLRFKRVQEAKWEWLKRPRIRWHPRWHFHHWRIQIHPIHNFKRWAFSRCCKCGGRFKWNESVCSNSWHGTGPLWFRSEKGIYHGSHESISGPAQLKESQL